MLEKTKGSIFKLAERGVCVVCSDGSINSQEYKMFEIYAVATKIANVDD